MKMAMNKGVVAQGITKALLVALAAGAVITLALMFPGIGWVYKAFKKEQWEKAKKRGSLRSTIKRLEKQKLVSWHEKPNGEVRLTLTEKGKKRVLQYKIDEMEIKKPNKWDGLWRIIIFDVPEDMRKARDIFRNKLKDLDFYMLQESVFIFPYECKDEIDFLKHNLEISPYVTYITANKIEGIGLRRKFGIRQLSTRPLKKIV